MTSTVGWNRPVTDTITETNHPSIKARILHVRFAPTVSAFNRKYLCIYSVTWPYYSCVKVVRS